MKIEQEHYEQCRALGLDLKKATSRFTRERWGGKYALFNRGGTTIRWAGSDPDNLMWFLAAEADRMRDSIAA